MPTNTPNNILEFLQRVYIIGRHNDSRFPLKKLTITFVCLLVCLGCVTTHICAETWFPLTCTVYRELTHRINQPMSNGFIFDIHPGIEFIKFKISWYLNREINPYDRTINAAISLDLNIPPRVLSSWWWLNWIDKNMRSYVISSN